MAVGAKIKGITIEFNGDTTKLGKALKDINDKAKGVDKELQAVNKSLKFNPKNTELLAQKQTLLKDKIKQTENQLKAFKDAEKTMKGNGVDENSADFRELRRNIIETESKLKHFSGELKKVRSAKLTQLGQSFKDIGAKMQTVGKGFTKYVTGPIMAIGGASVKSFNDVKDGLNIVTKKTGAAGKELQEMQGYARELAKTLPTSFEAAGTAVGEVNTRFGVTGKELEKLAGQFIKFAKVNDADLNTSIDQTQKALSAFGLNAKSAPAMLDAMTRAAQKSGVSVDTLSSGLIQNATAFEQMGLNIWQSVDVMAQMEKSGANSETVMQGLRKALKNAAKDGKPLNEALAELQNTIKNGKGDMDGLTAAYDLFGKSGDQIYAAVRNGTLDFSELGATMEMTGGTLDDVFNRTLTPSEQFQKTLNTLKDTGYELGNNLMTLLAPALEKIAAGAEKVSTFWKGLSKDQQDLIIKIGLAVAAIGPLLIVIGKISAGIGTIITLLPVISGPAAIAIAAIAGIIAIGILLVKNWDKIKAAAGKLHDWIVGKWQAVKDKTAQIWGKIKDVMLWPFRKARDGIRKIIDTIRGFFDFDFKLPKLKLPHFSISPPGWKFRDLLHGEIPRLGIDWYAKGGIFESPSVIGVGEAGAEAVLPIEKLNGMLMGMADSIVNGVIAGQNMQPTPGDIVIPIYLYPSGPKMGEQIVKSYDTYKRQLG